MSFMLIVVPMVLIVVSCARNAIVLMGIIIFWIIRFPIF
jgi:hypothetical protein